MFSCISRNIHQSIKPQCIFQYIKSQSTLQSIRIIKRDYTIDSKSILSLFDNDNVSLYNTIDDALKFYIEQDIGSTLNSPKPLESPDQDLDSNIAYHHHIYLSNLIAQHFPVEADRIKVKKQRKALPKMKMTNYKSTKDYMVFISTLYKTTENSIVEGPFKLTTNEIRLSELERSTIHYYKNVFDSYSKLPKPRPDHIEPTHLENLIWIFMNVNKNLLISGPSEFRSGVVSGYFRILTDLLDCRIPLTLKEKNHLLYMKHWFYRYKDLLWGSDAAGRRPDLYKAWQQKLALDQAALWDDYVLFSENNSGTPADVSSYNIYLISAVKLRHGKLLDLIVSHLKENGIYADRRTIPILLRYYATQGDSQKFDLVIRAFLQLKITLDISLVNSLIWNLLKFEEWDCAITVFQHVLTMSLNEQNTRPALLNHSRSLKDQVKVKAIDALRLKTDFHNGRNLIFRFGINQATISAFITYCSTHPDIGFDKIVKLLVLSVPHDAKQLVLSQFNASNPNTITMILIHPAYHGQPLRGVSGPTDTDYLAILNGFITANRNHPHQPNPSWNLHNLQLLTNLFLHNLTSTLAMPQNQRILYRFLSAYSEVLRLGNIAHDIQLDISTVLGSGTASGPHTPFDNLQNLQDVLFTYLKDTDFLNKVSKHSQRTISTARYLQQVSAALKNLRSLIRTVRMNGQFDDDTYDEITFQSMSAATSVQYVLTQLAGLKF